MGAYVNSEENLYRQIAQFMSYQYRDVIYHFDFGSGARLTRRAAVAQSKLNNRGYPDLFIAEPKGGFHGLYIELKTEGNSPFKKDGTLKTNEHLREQAEMLQKLRDKGYKAEFSTGINETIELIKDYLAK